MSLVRFRRRSVRLSKKLIGKWQRGRRRSLGDKLQVIAGRSPQHLKIVEAVADLILMRLRK